MDPAQMKEQYSISYLRAIAATAGVSLYEPEVDDDSVDFGMACGSANNWTARPRIELQLKCTSMEVLHLEYLSYPLSIKNYDDLRIEELLVPRILVVLLAPAQSNQWLTQTEDALTVRHCAYWMSLRGHAPVPNETSVTVRLPRAQVLSPETVRGMMDRVNDGGLP